jgi:hypothetical protein
LHVTYAEKQISPVNQAGFCGFAEFASTFLFYAPYLNFPPSHGCRKAEKENTCCKFRETTKNLRD